MGVGALFTGYRLQDRSNTLSLLCKHFYLFVQCCQLMNEQQLYESTTADHVWQKTCGRLFFRGFHLQDRSNTCLWSLSLLCKHFYLFVQCCQLMNKQQLYESTTADHVWQKTCGRLLFRGFHLQDRSNTCLWYLSLLCKHFYLFVQCCQLMNEQQLYESTTTDHVWQTTCGRPRWLDQVG